MHAAHKCSFLSAQEVSPIVCLANKASPSETEDSGGLHSDPMAK